jgi:hypothetical protein
MDWNAIGAIAELVGAVAVVATLAYLATQVRQSNLSARVASRQEMARQYADFADGLIHSPDTNRIYRTGLADGELSEEDRVLFSTIMNKCFWYFSTLYFQAEIYSLTDTEWHQSKMMIQRVSHNPGVEIWWGKHKGDYDPHFVKYMDTKIWSNV